MTTRAETMKFPWVRRQEAVTLPACLGGERRTSSQGGLLPRGHAGRVTASCRRTQGFSGEEENNVQMVHCSNNSINRFVVVLALAHRCATVVRACQYTSNNDSGGRNTISATN